VKASQTFESIYRWNGDYLVDLSALDKRVIDGTLL